MNLTESQLFTIEALNRIDGFVWPEKAKFAAMDEDDFRVHFYRGEPRTYSSQFLSYGTHATARNAGVKHPDWRNSLITREQFDSVDGWVRSWVTSVPEKIPSNGIEVECGAFGRKWRYRNPTKEAEMQPEAPKQPSIDELYSQYKTQRGIVESAKKALADEMEAEDKLIEQIKAWNLEHGFDVRLLDESEEKPELVITDWRDLRVGDVVWWSGAGCIDSGEYVVSNVESNDYKGSTAFCVSCAHGLEWVSTKFEKWKFIRRQSK